MLKCFEWVWVINIVVINGCSALQYVCYAEKNYSVLGIGAPSLGWNMQLFHRQLCRLNMCETFSGKTKKNQTNTAVLAASQSYVHLISKYTGPSWWINYVPVCVVLLTSRVKLMKSKNNRWLCLFKSYYCAAKTLLTCW